jgi:chorismate mutase/prephenate dehydratase
MAVEKYGLVSLKSGIRDSKYNTTRFIKIVKQPVIGENADTVSMALTIDDRAGILANAAAIFRDNGINMHKIESRPIPNTPSEYSLYVDFEGNLFDTHTRSMLLQLEKEFKDVCVFGNYTSI